MAPNGETTPLLATPDAPADPAPWLGYAVAGAIGLALVGYLLLARRRRPTEGRADEPEPW